MNGNSMRKLRTILFSTLNHIVLAKSVEKATFGPAPLQKCVGEFVANKFWRILPGIFLEDFSGHFFPPQK